MNNWNINPESLLNIPGNVWIYWKNLDGLYLGSNDSMAEDFQLANRKDVIGRSDFDFDHLSPKSAKVFRDEDNIIVTQRIVKNFHETAILKDKVDAFSTIKMPLYQDDHLIGLVGISYKISSDIDQLLEKLSKRENEVVMLLIKGHTAQGIGAELGLSTRTIESYINNIKFKLNVNNKQELIAKLIIKFIR